MHLVGDPRSVHRPLAVAAVAVVLLFPASMRAQIVDPYYSGAYTAVDLGPVTDLPPYYGGLTFLYNDPNTILIGGNANDAPGALYSVGVARDADNHITGFSGSAQRFADAAYNDGGVAYGPGNVLFLARWPVNELGQTKPGSTTTDKIVDLTPFGVTGSSIAALNFVPTGFGGAGSLKFATWEEGNWYDVDFAPDGTGTYDITGVTAVPGSQLPGGPEGFVYVSPSSPLFGTHSILVSAWSEGQVDSYEVDALGDPVVGSRRRFLSDIPGAEGAAFDPLTGDFLFSTFGDVSRVVAVRGFDLPPAPVPEPGSIALLGLGLAVAGVAGWRSRSRSRR